MSAHPIDEEEGIRRRDPDDDSSSDEDPDLPSSTNVRSKYLPWMGIQVGVILILACGLVYFAVFPNCPPCVWPPCPSCPKCPKCPPKSPPKQPVAPPPVPLSSLRFFAADFSTPNKHPALALLSYVKSMNLNSSGLKASLSQIVHSPPSAGGLHLSSAAYEVVETKPISEKNVTVLALVWMGSSGAGNYGALMNSSFQQMKTLGLIRDNEIVYVLVGRFVSGQCQLLSSYRQTIGTYVSSVAQQSQTSGLGIEVKTTFAEIVFVLKQDCFGICGSENEARPDFVHFWKTVEGDLTK